MKLKHNCVRDILLYCEENITFGDNLSWKPHTLTMFCESLSSHSREDITYTLIQLEEAGYIDARIMEADSGIYGIVVYRLTYSGHEFIDVLKSDTVWQKLQTTISSIGSVSLPVLQEIGTKFLLNHFGIQ